MHQLAERLSPVSTSLVNSRGIATSAVRRSDEEKVGAAFKFFTDFCDNLYNDSLLHIVVGSRIDSIVRIPV